MLIHTASSGESVTGETRRSISEHEDGCPVKAVPEAGYRFSGWSDGLMSAERTDTAVTDNLTVTALFEREASAPNRWFFICAKPAKQPFCELSSFAVLLHFRDYVIMDNMHHRKSCIKYFL